MSNAFKLAKDSPQAVIYIKEINATCEHDTALKFNLSEEIRNNMSSTVFVIASTSIPCKDIHRELRRAFDNEKALGIPNIESSHQILCILTEQKPLADDVKLAELAQRTSGFLRSDLQLLCKSAATEQLKENYSLVETSHFSSLAISHKNFIDALASCITSVQGEYATKIPVETWADIGGMEAEKREMNRIVTIPLQHPEAFKMYRIPPYQSLLLMGPPGCGKTMFVKAMANELGLVFIAIKGPQLSSKYIGESERQLREVFSLAKRLAPSVLFFDEIDSIAHKRTAARTYTNDIVNQLITEMDDVSVDSKVMVVGATNRPETLDPAVIRQGRFNRRIYIGLPDQASREAMLRANLRSVPTHSSLDAALTEIAIKTNGSLIITVDMGDSTKHFSSNIT